MRIEAFVRGDITLKSLEKVSCLLYAMSDVTTLTMSHFTVAITVVLWQNLQYGYKHIHNRTSSTMGVAT
jgi:hypothetical protein